MTEAGFKSCMGKLAICWLLLLPGLVRADTYLLLITGLTGEDSYRQTFTRWAGQLIDAARQAGLADQRIVHLTPEDPAALAASGPEVTGSEVSGSEAVAPPIEPPAKATYRTGLSTREGIAQAIAELGELIGAQDQLWIVLLGHGSEQGGQGYFNIPGPDISAAQFARYLAPLTPERLVFVATMSSSGAFLQDLASPQRIVISATRSGAERYFAQFGEFWIAALDPQQGGDLDKDGKISLLEAFNFARSEVEQFYRNDRRLQTEHAVLDDNGDGRGSFEPQPYGTEDGALAARTYLVDRSDLAAADPQLSGLLEQQQTLEQRLQDWVGRKSELAEAAYYDGLEALLVELIPVDRALRSKEPSGQE